MFYQYILRFVVFLYGGFLGIISHFPRRKIRSEGKAEVLATGTFYSDNWLVTHLKPLAMSKEVSVVKMVSITPVPDIENVVGVYPPDGLRRIFGNVPARLLYYFWLAIKSRPDYLLGFHLLINGMATILIARLVGARSIYICGGGPREVQGGGIDTESKIFNRLAKPDLFIEKRLIKALDICDLVVTMGTGAKEYFQSKSVKSRIEIIPGGFDSDKFSPSKNEKEYDLILIGRLSKVKRVDIFLSAIEIAKKTKKDIKAVVVGDGPDSQLLKSQCKKIGLEDNVVFAGWQNNVEEWLRNSRVFVLTSESEGLSQALIQGMLAGLPAVVSDIGDLSDLVVNGKNGYLINKLEPELFADAFISVLQNDKHYAELSECAFRDTRKFSYEQVSKKWNDLLG